MATVRVEVELDYSADHVWHIVCDPLSVAQWSPGVKTAVLDSDGVRVCSLNNGARIKETFVIYDGVRTFDYQVVSGIPVESHRAWIQVTETSGERCLVVYGTEVAPDDMGPILEQSSATALKGLERFLGAEPR